MKLTLAERREKATVEMQAAHAALAEADAGVRTAKDRVKAAQRRLTRAIAAHGKAWGTTGETQEC